MSTEQTTAFVISEPITMAPQPYCSVCGTAPGGANKVRIVDGERLEYPENIDAHHPFGRPGPVVYICHRCHMAHHARAPYLDIKWQDGWTLGGKALHVWNGWD